MNLIERIEHGRRQSELARLLDTETGHVTAAAIRWRRASTSKELREDSKAGVYGDLRRRLVSWARIWDELAAIEDALADDAEDEPTPAEQWDELSQEPPC